MGKKINNLIELQQNNYNIFTYEEINTYEQLINYSKINKQFTIRFDRDSKIESLPFYVIDQTIINKEDYFKNIISEMKKLGCTLLCSNGLKDDAYLKFNFVIEINNSYDFILEFSDKKIPLRQMYNYKTTIVKGNLLKEFNTFSIINQQDNKYMRKDIENILTYILKHKSNYKIFEGTYYDKNVGIYMENIIIWQTN